MPEKPGILDFAWEPDTAVQVQRGEFDMRQKVYAWEGQNRKATVRLGEIVDETVAKQWMSFIQKLNGPYGTFLMQDPKCAAHRGAYDFETGFAPKVKGGSQNGPDLETDGWPTGVSGLLLEGDYISIQGRLYQLLADADSDGSGNADLLVYPHVRNDVLDNADITVGIEAFGLFRLLEFPRFPYKVDVFMSGFAFGCEEAI